MASSSNQPKHTFIDRPSFDIVLKTKDRDFRCEKSILGSASPVFQDMIEKCTQNVIDLKEILSTQQVEDMLLLMYENKVPEDRCRLAALQSVAYQYRFKNTDYIQELWQRQWGKINKQMREPDLEENDYEDYSAYESQSVRDIVDSDEYDSD